MTRKRLSRALQHGVIGAALWLAAFSPPAAWVERVYAGGVFPVIQRALTGACNAVPFVLGDVLLVLAALGPPVLSGVHIARAGRGKRGRAAGQAAQATLALVCAVFLVFQAVWGLNYRRVPLSHKLHYDETRVTPHALRRLARQTVAQMNAAALRAHAAPWPAPARWQRDLQPHFEATVRAMGNQHGITFARPKRSLLDPYLAATGVAGFISPFTLEVVQSSAQSLPEQPFTLAHEWAHLAGFASESEANVVALVTCLRSPDPHVRYAGWLGLFRYLPRHALQHTPRLRLAPVVKADLRIMRDRVRARARPALARQRQAAYDRYLKANHVHAGTKSYGEMVPLVLGTRLADELFVPQP